MRTLTPQLYPLPVGTEAAAQCWLELPARAPRKPRLASSVVIVRDGRHGCETFMTERSESSPLGVLAFPGGSVQGSDSNVVKMAGPPLTWWAREMGTDPDTAKAHLVAAIRETFEETGLLYAGPDENSMVDDIATPEWVNYRERLAAEEFTFGELLARRRLVLRADLLRPASHWVSPDYAHRRFDTRYFRAAAPVGQTARLLPSKGRWGSWVSPAAVLEGRLDSHPRLAGRDIGAHMSPATHRILEKIGSAKGAVAFLCARRCQGERHPELVEHEGTLMLSVSLPPTSC